jgi:hypothetical protein
MDAMFKFDDEMFEDDWGDADDTTPSYVAVSNKATRNGNEFETTFDVREKETSGPEKDRHNMFVGANMKCNFPWMGHNHQVEMSHENMENRTEFDSVSPLKALHESLDGVHAHAEGQFKEHIKVGVSYKHNDLWMKALFNPFDANNRANMFAHWTWNMCPGAVFGGHIDLDKSTGKYVNSMMNGAEWNVDGTGMRVGAKWDTKMTEMMKF